MCLAGQEATYAGEVNGLRWLVAAMEDRRKQTRDIVDGIERVWALSGMQSAENQELDASSRHTRMQRHARNISRVS